MEGCDCKAESQCSKTYPCEDRMQLEGSVTDLGLSFNSMFTAAVTVLGWLLYRFSQGLPAAIRWPIRVICSVTGLTSLWSWVSHLLQTLLRLQSLFKWLSKLWKIIIRLFKGSSHQRGQFQSTSQVIGNPWDSGLRVVLVGPVGVGRSLVLDALLGCGRRSGGGTRCVSMESVSWTAVVDRRQVTVVDTPDLLGTSLGMRERVQESLRSLHLASPGPHAFLLVIQIPAPSSWVGADATKTLRTLLNLVGEGALSYVLPVLTYTGSIKSSIVSNQLLEGVPGELKAMLSLCCHSPTVLYYHCPQAKRRVLESELFKRVEQMAMLGGFYLHELQRKKECFQEMLLKDMAATLEQKLVEKEKQEESCM